ncbi:hypothetical protein ACFPOU_07825 [Massilia jejuensis]|uniref:Uncharacterized protein n=1 Tax=Massilia jejuensis TaxID=648894 RepID=A0ABW0PH79_9BURK
MKGVEFHFLGGHYVLLDKQTGLFHDMEAPQGVRGKRELPIWSRTSELSGAVRGDANFESTFLRYAALWLQRRNGEHPHLAL